MSFSFIALELMKKSEPAVADQEKRSVQPLGGDDSHVVAATTSDASAPLTSTSKEEHISTRNAHPASAFNGRSSLGIGSSTQHAGDLGAPGKLVIS